MSETLLAAFIGALFGGFITQLTLFWLNGRKEKRDKRDQAVKKLTKAELKTILLEKNSDNVTEAHRIVNDRINEWVDEIESASDAQLNVYLAIGELYEEELLKDSLTT